MNGYYSCSKCGKTFSGKYNYDRHINKIKSCVKGDSLSICCYCGDSVKHAKNLKRHQDNCPKNYTKYTQYKEPVKPKIGTKISYDVNNEILKRLNDLENKMEKKPSNVTNNEEILKRLNKLEQEPRVNNQILQVMCVGNEDNYLDILTEQLGFDKALGFIKDCALSRLSGDCKLLENIYFMDNIEPPIQYLDKNKNKIEFVDEKKQRIVDPRGVLLGKRLANNLQNSYLKGVNHLTTDTENRDKTNFDIHSWNQHIYDLSDSHYQRKLIAQLKIPHRH